MNKNLLVAAVVLIATILASGLAPPFAASPAKQNSGPSATVATVNGHPVTQDMLDEKIEQLYPTNTVHVRPGGTEELRQKAFDAVVLDELVWQEARRQGKVIPWAKAHQEMLHVRRLCGPAEFDAGLRMRGLSRDQYTRILQRSLTVQAATRKHVELAAKVTPAEAHAFFETNRSRFHRPDRVRIRLILVAVDQKAAPEVEQAAKKKADDIYAKLKAGTDFADLASDVSEDEYRFKGGDVGWMHKGSMDADFEPLAFSLPIGQITAPFRTPPGYSIMRVDAREPAKDLTYEEVREKLMAQLTIQKSKQLQQAWEVALKKNARIEIIGSGQAVQAAAMPVGTQTAAGVVASH